MLQTVVLIPTEEEPLESTAPPEHARPTSPEEVPQASVGSSPPSQPEPAAPAEERKATKYVVLAQLDQDDRETWALIGHYEATNDRKAKHDAFLSLSEEQRAAGARLVTVPARSWRPEVAREEEKRETVVRFE